MATQVTLFPFAGLPAPANGEPPNHDNGAGPVRVAIQDPGVDLAKKTVCIKMRLSTMGKTRKVSTSQIEADADKDLLRVSKHLLDSAELKAIGCFDGEIRRFLYNICLPFEIGIHLLPIAALETVEDRMQKFAEDRQVLVTAFLSVYPGLCQDAAKRLRGLYNPTDYPPVDDVARFAQRRGSHVDIQAGAVQRFIVRLAHGGREGADQIEMGSRTQQFSRQNRCR